MTLTDFTPEQELEVFHHALLFSDIFLYILGGLLVIGLILTAIKSYRQNQYIKTLNEHDKAVIQTYQSIQPFEIKRKNKNEKQTAENTTSKQN